MNKLSLYTVRFLTLVIFITAACSLVFNGQIKGLTDDIISSLIFVALPLTFFYNKLRHYQVISIFMALYAILIHFGSLLYIKDYEILAEAAKPDLNSWPFIFFYSLPSLYGSIILLSSAESFVRLNQRNRLLGVLIEAVAYLLTMATFAVFVIEITTGHLNLQFSYFVGHMYLPYIAIIILFAILKSHPRNLSQGNSNQ